MCGVFASVKITNVINALKTLQSRGMDSFGIGEFKRKIPLIYKHVGQNINSTDILSRQSWKNNYKIGQTRWASKGKVCLENTHPFISENQNILLVHNGTLSNYNDIANTLASTYKKDYENSTDTEVLTDFIGNQLFVAGYKDKPLKDIIDNNFKGTYAILFLKSGENKTVHYMTQDIPLYYYEGEFSSDASVFPYYFLLPNYSAGCCFANSNNQYTLIIDEIEVKPIYETNPSFTSNQKSSNDLMYSEICEQSKLDYKWFFGYELNPIYNSKDLHLIGCGSSYNACLLGKKYFDMSCRLNNVNVYYASEYDSQNEAIKIFVSQSGETADILEHLISANPALSTNYIITNNANSTAKKYAYPLYLEAGPEYAIAATKTFTSTCLSLLNLSNHDFYKNDLNLNEFREHINQLINQNDEIDILANQINHFKHFLTLGSGLNYPIAREISLKLKEVANCFVESIPSSEIKHGNIAIITSDVLSIFIMPKSSDKKYNRILGNIEQIKARNGVILGIGPECNNCFDYYIKIPETIEVLQPILNNIAGQLLAYNLALIRGLNPSFSRNCAKAITVY